MCPLCPPCSCHASADPPDLPSFPTRRSSDLGRFAGQHPVPVLLGDGGLVGPGGDLGEQPQVLVPHGAEDRKSTRLNSSHVAISYAVFCLNKKTSRTSARAPSITKNATYPQDS